MQTLISISDEKPAPLRRAYLPQIFLNTVFQSQTRGEGVVNIPCLCPSSSLASSGVSDKPRVALSRFAVNCTFCCTLLICPPIIALPSHILVLLRRQSTSRRGDK